MKMHTAPLPVNAQGSHEARQHGARSLQMPAARPVRLVCVGVKIGRKIALQFDADLPRHRRPFLVLDIKPEPQAEPARPTATYGDVEVVDLGPDYDPQTSPDTVDTLDGQPEPATEPEPLRPKDLDAPVPYLPTVLGAYPLGLGHLILEDDEEDEDEDASLDDGEDDLTDEPIGYALANNPNDQSDDEPEDEDGEGGGKMRCDNCGYSNFTGIWWTRPCQWICNVCGGKSFTWDRHDDPEPEEDADLEQRARPLSPEEDADLEQRVRRSIEEEESYPEDDLTDEPIGYTLGFEPDPDYIAHCIAEEEGGWLCDGKRCDEGDADERETEEEYWARVALDDLRDTGRPSKFDDRDL
jgi:hypothetical protein